MPRRVFLCHDCSLVLSADDRAHYVYQCHGCVMLEHDRLRLAAADPDHPEAALLGSSAVDLDPPPQKIDLTRRVA